MKKDKSNTAETYSNEQYWREIGGAVFATGAHIEAVEFGGEWRWIVTGFEDDTFFDGKILEVNRRAAARAALVEVDEDEARAGKEFPEDEDNDKAVCIGCSRAIGDGEAHNETTTGTLCETCHNLTAEVGE